ncbi:MAG TPA: class I SAM-dependent methyltransferase [Pirellulales bacterium]|nr:class I SAM-dependent methyltransferase [Pirellulales bacterium]
MGNSRTRARALAAQHLGEGDYLGWFEPLYAEAGDNPRDIPWVDLSPNPHLVSWFSEESGRVPRGSALVVGCGLGDDAEYLGAHGFRVTAFDVSPTAVDWCRRRFPQSPVVYEVRDLFHAPIAWRGAFDLIFEAYTLQVFPQSIRPGAMREMSKWLSPAGRLVVITRGREIDGPEGQMPWPLTRAELGMFEEAGLACQRFDDFLDDEQPPVRRFRACYRPSYEP